MKTTIKTIILASASLFAAMSCQKETAGTQDLVKEGETIQVNINAGLGDFVAADATKATATPVVRLEWSDTDKVQAYYGNSNVGTDLTVTPSENKIFAKLSGTITAPSGHTIGDDDIITFVYSNGCTVENNLTFNFSNQNATIPFVAYATVKYGDLTSNFSDKMVEFKFATSVMKIAATGLDGSEISSATIDGINTKVTLTPSESSETCGIAGSVKATINKTAGIDASTDKTRAIFTVGLVPDNNTSRKLQINGWEADLTSNIIAASKSYTTPCAFESSDEYVVMKMKSDHSGKLKWAKKNLGASDINAFGELYSWGEVATKFNYTQSEYVASGISGNLSKADRNDVANAIKGGKWRMPTREEFMDLDRACGGSGANSQSYTGTLSIIDGKVPIGKYWIDTGAMTTLSGSSIDELKGITVTGLLYSDGEHYLFFPAAGDSFGASRSYVGTSGSYWSSTKRNNYDAYFFYFDSSGVNPGYDNYRYYGRAVRPVSD